MPPGARANEADIHLLSDLQHLELRIGTSGPGCPGGQYWHTGSGRCSPAVALRSETTSRSCSCTCPTGQAGSCSATQQGSYTVYGWLLPPSGAVRVDRQSAVSWGACTVTRSSCAAAPPPSGPQVGTTFVMAGNLICSSADAGYDYGPFGTPMSLVPGTVRKEIVAAYKSLPSQRCPEAGDPISFSASYPYWVTQAGELMNGTHQLHQGRRFTEMEARYWIRDAIPVAGAGETLPMMDGWCQSAANAKYGKNKTIAKFIRKSESGYTGKTCRVTTVN